MRSPLWHISSSKQRGGLSEDTPDYGIRVWGLFCASVLFMWLLSAVTSPYVFTPVAAILAGLATRGLISWLRNTDKRDEEARRDLNLQLERRVRTGKRIAIRDPFTMLLHRWYFELRVGEEVNRCQRYGTSMSILCVGADPGLRRARPLPPDGEVAIAKILGKNLRSIDLVAKIGDYEYAVCLPQTEEAGARVVAARVMADAGEHSFVVGLAICPRDGIEFDALLAKAHASQASGELEVSQEVSVQTAPQLGQAELVQILSNETSGELPIEEGATGRRIKATLKRASRKAGVEIKVWEKNGIVFFERKDVEAPATDVA